MRNPPMLTPATRTPTPPARLSFSSILSRTKHQDAGQALIEMALALPLFLLTVFGMFQYSILLVTYCNATYACRVATKYASMHSNSSLAPTTTTQIQNIVKSNVMFGTVTPTVNVNYFTQSFGTGSSIVGNVVEVDVELTPTVRVPFMSAANVSVGTQDYRLISR